MADHDAVTAYVGAFVDELSRAGVRHVVISPGSRSTPLAMLMASHVNMHVWMHVDERSAAFFALGMAKARREPVAILCTSGTAAANYYPAVVEASIGRVPLIVLTADRPHELRDIGAPQAIDQIGLYGSYVKWFIEMALPEATPTMLAYARTMAGRAVAEAIAQPNGPVHLNFPFREPFIPELSSGVRAGGRESNRRYVQVAQGAQKLDKQQIDRLADELLGVERGLIVCGPMDCIGFSQAVLKLAERLQFPVLADPLSQLRSGTHDKHFVIDAYNAFLRNEKVVRRFKPDVVIRFGAMPVSKSFLLYMKKHSSSGQIVVDQGAGWREPTLLASDMVYADPVHFCHALNEAVDRKVRVSQKEWAQSWVQLNRLTKQIISEQSRSNELFEGRVLAELADCLPEEAILFVGNSMPVRDLDTFFTNNSKAVRTMANRGASGIDGVVSSALGASTTGAPLVLVIGDLSFFHDLNGLLAAKLYELNITIVVVNNDGGGIFSFLPQAQEEHREHFELLFGTPTGLDYRHAVNMYGGSFTRVCNWEQFRHAVDEGMATGGLAVVEVPTDREQNAAQHREIWQTVSRELDSQLEGGSGCSSQ